MKNPLVVRTLVGKNVNFLNDGYGIFPNIMKSLTLIYLRLDKLTPLNSNQGTTQSLEFSGDRYTYHVSCRWQMGKPTRIGISAPHGKYGRLEVVYAIVEHDTTGRIMNVEIEENFPSFFGVLDLKHKSDICWFWRHAATCPNAKVIKPNPNAMC